MADRYIGIDAHQQSCTLAVMGPSGKRIREIVVETSQPELNETLKRIRGERHICLEEGEYSEWLYELCDPLAKSVVVVRPKKTNGTKNDSRDAWARADELRRGEIKRPIYKSASQYRGLREAVRAHQMALGDLIRTKNRLRGVFRGRGVKANARDLYECGARGPWLALLPSAVRRRADLIADELDRLTDVHERAEAWLIEEGSRTPAVKLLSTAPGIGVIRGSQIVAVVVTPHRFRSSRQFWSYCGLGIVTHSSSDWVQIRGAGWKRKEVPQTRGLNRNRNAILKNVFKGAAVAVTQNMPANPLTLHYHQMLEHTKPNLARLTIARRLAATVLSMWKHREVYDPAKQNHPARE